MLVKFHGMALEGFQSVVAVLVRVAIAVMKDCDQKPLGVGEGLIPFTLPYRCSPSKEARAGTPTGQEPGGRG